MARATATPKQDESTSIPFDVFCELLDSGSSESINPLTLAELSPPILHHLHTHASQQRDRAIEEARVLLEVALESIEIGLTMENQRHLLERAHARLVLAERQGVMAENAGCLSAQPELLRAERPRSVRGVSTSRR